MKFDRKHISVSVGGREISFETGKIARQANAAVIVRCGETILLTTACATATASEDIDFLPLRVDYQEKFSSTGKTLGGFIKREGRPTERETLVCRLIDRPIRPLFEDGYHNEVQLLSYVYSYDGTHSPEPLAICGASAALVISDIPFIKPVGAVRVGMIGENFIVNPTIEEQKKSRLDLILAGTEEAILMIEGYADFLTEEQILAAVEEGHQAIRLICQTLSDWQKVIGKPKARGTLRVMPKELADEIYALTHQQLNQVLRIKEKKEREQATGVLANELLEKYLNQDPLKYNKTTVLTVFKKIQSDILRKMILSESFRSDGRACDQVRPIDIEMSLLPRTHGSALFTRGETQSLAVCTLGSETMAQRSENLEGENNARFYLQYFFPHFL